MQLIVWDTYFIYSSEKFLYKDIKGSFFFKYKYSSTLFEALAAVLVNPLLDFLLLRVSVQGLIQKKKG